MAVRGPGDPARAAARLLGRRLRTGRSDGSLGGDPNVTSVAVLALRKRRPGRAARAAAWLVSRQGRGGGIGHRAGAPPDVDTTALAAWALAVTGRRGAARAAASFVREAQATGGGFPSLPGGAPNSQSTGLALVALRVAGLGPRAARSAGGLTGLDHLASLARRDGSISYAHRSSPTPIWSTAQALLGLSSKRRLLSFRPGAS